MGAAHTIHMKNKHNSIKGPFFPKGTNGPFFFCALFRKAVPEKEEHGG